MDTRTVDLGPCHCAGTPHERDEAVIVEPASMTYGAQRRIRSAYGLELGGERDGSDRYGGLADATLMALCTLSWTCVDAAGRIRPIGGNATDPLASIDALDPLTAMRLHEAFFPTDPATGNATDKHGYFMRGIAGIVLPNPPSAPSADGRPEPPSTGSAPSPKVSKGTRRAQS